MKKYKEMTEIKHLLFDWVNTFTVDDKDTGHNRGNLPLPLQIQLIKKRNILRPFILLHFRNLI